METIERMIAEFADNEKKVISLTSNKKNQYLNPFFFCLATQRYLITFNERISKLVFISFFTLVSGTALLCAISLFENPEKSMLNFPYHAYYPDSWPILLRALACSVSTAWDAIIIVVHDCFIMSMMNHTCAQLLVLKETLINLSADNYDAPPLKQLKNCVRHHQMIIELRNGIESNFSSMVLLQFLASLFIFGLTGFQATVSSYRQIMVYAYCCCVSSQLLIYCWFAHQIIDQVQRPKLIASKMK